ncbi:DEKNAAC100164 [Brettanomyces naardenensis]|uniref:DEKNAAC100164 n=1 Tax=Brettanomyces naardenensis TaxID=13370 RepID=A0A448YF27_BRENA|nr:DEKNAAC100164 [Brettanomyces naardenensis]
MSLVKLADATFTSSLGYGKKALRIFNEPINFSIGKKEKWAIVGDSNKTNFLKVLAGSYLPNKPTARTYPEELKNPRFNTELLKFVNNGNWGYGAQDQSGGFTHLSGRYEFFKDLEIDIKVRDFIASKHDNSNVEYDPERLEYLLECLDLKGLEDKFLTVLSNGQFRRARIAKVLYREPGLLLIDDPFLGLDPVATERVSDVLEKIAYSDSEPTTVAVGLRVQDDIPEWIEKVAIVDKTGVPLQGEISDLKSELQRLKEEFYNHHEAVKMRVSERIQVNNIEKNTAVGDPAPTAMIEMTNVSIKYKGVPVIKDLNWTVNEGEKWHIRGRNGSGKTTLLSLITLDHPQSWSRNIKVEGKHRAAGNVNYFDVNKSIGFTSPELHAIFPRNLSVFQAISTGYVVGSYIPPKNLTREQKDKIIDYLKMVELEDKKDSKFGDLTVSHQKVVLLLRALINDPKILILDESLSAMTDEDVIKGKCIVDQWDKGCCLIIGHVDEEVPDCDKYILMNQARNGIYEIGDVAN